MPILKGEVIKLSSLCETTKSELSLLLERVGANIQDSKVLFIAPHIISTFDALGISKEIFTEERGVVGVIPFGCSDEIPPANHAVYLVNPDVEDLHKLVVGILSYSQKYTKASISVFFVPRQPLMVRHVLENEFKLLRSLPGLCLGEFDMDLVPLNVDVLSMQQPLAFKHLFSDGDVTLLQWIARMFLKLQTSHFGAIPLIRGKGLRAAKVVKMLSRMQSEVGSEFLTYITPEIDSLFILDRSLDLVTPMMTQLTYEGHIDELYKIDCGYVTLPFSLGENSKVKTGQRILLDNSDRVFKEIRDKDFASAGSVLSKNSHWVKQSYDKRREVQQLRELNEFMRGLPEVQELHRLTDIHTTIATMIHKTRESIEFRRRIEVEQSIVQQSNDRDVIDYIEEQINKGSPLEGVLRLIAMYSVVNGGLKAKVYDSLKEMLMLSYGIPHVIAAFFSFECCGLITKNDGKRWNYNSIRKQFRMWNDAFREQQVNDTSTEQQPSDSAYASSGYNPLSVRLLEGMICHPDLWNAPGDITEIVPGEKAEIRNEVEVPGSTRISMVFIIGGITRAEMSALRHLQRRLAQTGQPRHIVIASTNITNGSLMIESLLPFSTH